MRYARFLPALALPLALATAPAMAADNTRDGGLEFTLAGNGSSDNDVETGSFNGEASLGIFLGPSFELGVRQTVGYSDVGAGTNVNASTRGFLDYQLNLGRFAPFIGVNFGYVYGDTVSDTFAAGPEAGVKFYLGETNDVFVFGRVEYQYFFDEDEELDEIFDGDGQLLYTLGIGIRL
ncbi:MAG TPA: hypothetical protein VGN72_15935 [Tepidisphaeraceae bacterium]|jgi:hypothetical protein|nr:hypothetical protein [Tepidisphaeraceae bacterium]